MIFFGSMLLSPAQTPDQTPDRSVTGTAAELAARTSFLLPRRSTISLETQNLTSLPAAEWLSFRSSFQKELQKSGIQTAVTPPESVAVAPSRSGGTPSRVLITLSEDARGLLLVAEVFMGDNRQIAMLPWNLPASVPAKSRVAITRKVLWTQPGPILDILLVNPDSELVLSADQLVSYGVDGDKWSPAATASLLLPRPVPRDPRGRLSATADGFRAYLPGATCEGSFQPQFKAVCVPGNTNWAEARWVTDRNWLESDSIKAPFYSTGAGFFAMADGHIQDRAGRLLAGSESWGSDIAGLADPCVPGATAAAIVIASSASVERDEVRVFETASGQASPISDAVPLPGPVTALWPSGSEREATLVVHNLQTGEYEASRLVLACSQ